MKRFRNILTKALVVAIAAIAFQGATTLRAGEAVEAKEPKPPVVETPPGLRIHGLLQLEFSDQYITPRGLVVENQGVIFQPLLLLFWNLYASETGFLNDVTLTTGVWNSWHTRKSGVDPGEWNEIDPIVGLTFKFAKAFQFDAFYTAFVSQTNSYDTSTNLDLRLTYYDSFIPGFSINPFVEFFYDIDNIPVFFGAQNSWYFVLGINPTFQAGPVKIELPTSVNLVASDFYLRADGSDGGSGAAVFTTQLRASVPISFIPPSYGHWTFYAGVQYYHFNNDGLLDGNEILGAANSRDENLVQFHSGIRIFF
ncbi:MAG TPA: hypothetical protein VIT21_02280 [Chthoniobacterales bacterium]